MADPRTLNLACQFNILAIPNIPPLGSANDKGGSGLFFYFTGHWILFLRGHKIHSASQISDHGSLCLEKSLKPEWMQLFLLEVDE